jgi:hypothetical protein
MREEDLLMSYPARCLAYSSLQWQAKKQAKSKISKRGVL